MASIDDRIVRMEFDNAAFEKKIQSTLISLGQLDKALKMEGASKGLADVNTAASNMKFGSISDGIENVSKGFIALSTIAITALSQITSKVIQTGSQLIKSLAVDPILDGYHEYETNLQSIQTILANTASKGTTLDDVNAALQQLNEYSDKTIYNFAQMAKNIGTFTAAGVDLDTSVSAIKGIANLAALSGSSADQAASAMYQLSQALATGTLKLIDWNSVVNAGMGGEAFQNALFETGKALHTLTNVPMEQTFKQWKDAGNSFRDSLQDGWITADVLNTTLSTFTGDMTEEMLLAKGFSEDQALAMMKTAQLAKEAATQVKTFSQLVGTVKEAVGTGWADTFRLILGNFTEAREMWTNVNNAIGKFITNSADARNNLLALWNFLGGRTTLINAIKDAFANLGAVFSTIKDAFRDIFPATTIGQLMDLTNGFAELVKSMKPTEDQLRTIHTIAQGFFSALSIGWEILKEGVKFIVGLGRSLLGIFSPSVVGGLTKISDWFFLMKLRLVDFGGIEKFFGKLTEWAQKPIEFLDKLYNAVKNVFKGFAGSSADKIGEAADRIGDRFDSLKDRLSSLADPLMKAFDRVSEVVQRVGTEIKNWFSDLFDDIAASMKTGDFDAVLDALNTGLLGGIALILGKWLKGGINVDLGGGIFEKLSGVFGQLTSTLKTMQMQVKANIIMKIAEAIAILTASVVVLSLIDSAALTKALTAMAVGFGQLLAAFAGIEKLSVGPKGALDFAAVAVGLMVLAGAMILFGIAAKILSTMDWEEMGRGLTGFTALLGGLVLAVKPLSANSKGMISAGIGITGIATGMVILSVAMKIMASMNWEELGKGLVGVAGGLGSIVLAMRLMPNDLALIKAGASIFIIAVALNVLAGSVAIFASMNWESMGKGLLGLAVGLGAIVLALNLLPGDKSLTASAAAILIVSTAMLIMSMAIRSLGSMSWENLAKGLVGIAVAMGILVIAANLMESAIPGAGAMILVAGALLIIAKAIEKIGAMSWEDLIKGLVGIALAFLLIGGASLALTTVIPEILALGAALIVLGAGIALIGAGAFLLAEAFRIVTAASQKAIIALPKVMEAIGAALPALLKGLAEGLVEIIQVFTKAAPVIAKALGILLEHILDTLIKLTPKFARLISKMLEEGIKIIWKYTQPLVDAGIHIIESFLKGISDNIGPIVTMVADIITNFLDAMTEETPRVVDSLVDLFTTFFLETAEGLGEVSGTILFGVGQAFITGFLNGAEEQLNGPVFTWIGEILGKILGWIGDALTWLWQKGVDIITGLLNGITNAFTNISNWFGNLPTAVGNFFLNAITWLVDAGSNIITGLKNGLTSMWDTVVAWLGGVYRGVRDALISGPGQMINWLVDMGENIIHGLWNGIKNIWNKMTSWIEDAASHLPGFIKGPLGINSPAKVMIPLGESIPEGLWMGMKQGWTPVQTWLVGLSKDDSITGMGDRMSEAMGNVLDSLNAAPEFNPTITPVLDLTKVAAEASKIGGYLTTDQLSSDASFQTARVISDAQRAQVDSAPAEVATTKEINFNQVINAPTELSSSDIYKQTRNQLTMAKEALSIP